MTASRGRGRNAIAFTIGLAAALWLVPGAGAMVLSSSGAAAAQATCPCTLLSPASQPDLGGISTANGRSGGPWSLELGVKVFVDTPARLTGVRFYKDALETGAHTATIWTPSGVAIATVPFASETASGWQQQSLATPLSLAPGAVYVVSVGMNAFWGRTLSGLSSQISSGPLHSVADGQNGVFADAAGTFPTQSFLSSNYFVDVEVSDDAPGAAPTITSTQPAIGATGVALSATAAATFSKAMDASTITAGSFTLTDQFGNPAAATATYDGGSSTATLTPSAPLLASMTYTARLSTAVHAADGTPLAAGIAWSFTTVPGSTARINTGDGAYTTAGSIVYAADGFFTGGGTLSTTRAIARTADQFLYQNERWGQFSYAIPVVSGRYDVKLHFVEMYYGTLVPGCEGKRIFGIDILDTPASPDIANLDICSEVGPNAALDKIVRNVVVTDGVLDLKSVYGPTDDPELAAIEVVPAGTLGDVTPPGAPGTPNAVGGTTQASVTWPAATDDTGVTLYDVYRSTTSGFSPTFSTRVAQTTSTSYAESGLAAGTYYYVVKAEDAAGNIGAPSAQASAVVVADTTAPTAPGTLTATSGTAQAALSWKASTDDIGVTKYTVYRSTVSGFTPSAATQIVQLADTVTTHKDKNLAAGTYYYLVTASDAAGNASLPSNQASAVVVADTTPPTVSITAPAAGASVSGFYALTVKATDNVAVAGVQYMLDGQKLGAEVTASPWTLEWDTSLTANGGHVLTAVARDGAGNSTTSAAVSFTVANALPAPGTGLAAAYAFGQGGGSAVIDSSANGNTGTIANATWATGHTDGGLAFNGTNAMVTVPDAASLDFTKAVTLEAWVFPTALGNNWRVVVLKERPGNLTYGLYAGLGTPRPGLDIFTSQLFETKAPANLALNTWSFLAATSDGTTMRLYVNGTLVVSKPIGGTMAVGSGPLRIGGDGLGAEWFKGTLDDVRVYNRVLLGAEIQADMSTPVG